MPPEHTTFQVWRNTTVIIRRVAMIPLCPLPNDKTHLCLHVTKLSPNVCFPLTHMISNAMRKVDVLGVLRCDWAEVASLIGVAVTPVVGFLGNLSREQINPNPDEVGLLAVGME